MSGKEPKKNKSPGQPKVTRKKSPSDAAAQKANLSQVAKKQKRKNAGKEPPTLWRYTLLFVYKQLYLLGITILRRKLRCTRKIKKATARVKGRMYAALDAVWRGLVSFFKGVFNRILRPFRRIRTTSEEVRPIIEAAKVEGKIPLSSYWRIIASILKLFSTIFFTLLNYLAPVAAAFLLFNVIQMYINQPFALAVEYNGEIIGYVQNESEFEEAAQTLKDRFTEGTATIEIPYFSLVAVTSEEYSPPAGILGRLRLFDVVDEGLTTADELADKMVQASGGEIEHAYGLYVNDRFYGAVTDRTYLSTQLKRILEKNSTGEADSRAEFIKRIGVREGLYPVNSIISLKEMAEIIYADETVDQIYIAQEGDTPSGIAEKNGIPYALLKEYNRTIEDDLQIGDEIYLAVATPFLSVKNIYTAVYQEEFDYEVVEEENATYAVGFRSVVKEGVPGVQEVTAEITTINGIETERTVLGTRVVKEAVDEEVVVGTNTPQVSSGSSGSSVATDKTPSQAASSGFIWPTWGGYINGGVGSYRGHTGVDIPRPSGTPVYASAGGTVTRVERTYYNYGHYIIINHGGGYETLYAHCSELYVSVGQQVAQGEVIGAVGRTGRATGNHLHFEVRYQGRIQIPQNYIGYSP